MPVRRLAATLAVCTTYFLWVSLGRAAEDDVRRLAAELKPLLASLSGQQRSFTLTGRVTMQADSKPQSVELRLERFDDEAFDLDVTHPDYAIQLRRRADMTALALPKHQVVYRGQGEVDAVDHLQPRGIARRLVSAGSLVALYAPLIQQTDPQIVAFALSNLAQVRWDSAHERWGVGDSKWSFRISDEGRTLNVSAGDSQLDLSVAEADATAGPADQWPGMNVVTLERQELELQLARGCRRALEILAPSPLLKSPVRSDRQVEHGQLRWIEGQRVAILHGSPAEVGRAHGELLKEESYRCIDSVLYTFGTVQTIRTGRWFRHELEAAYARLSPHIPERHKVETRSLAAALDLDPQLVEVVNVFPELFHCSGFAVFGAATQGGKLYHGRVLDYMTAIGLQDAATTFIVAVDDAIPFANVGYAGFIGSVSGMNDRGISLGEMGGRGEGQWDGVPMATLMRRGLEECSTLDEVMSLWKDNPRTCQYYYVFADGKTRRAVGVAAVPESVEFVMPGQSHPLLGDGIPDAVVLSAGSRLEKLRERVQQRYGQIDAEVGQWLMSRPVAMDSNLHNVLFVPEDGVLYVANADHKRPAAECPYVRLDLHALLQSVPTPAVSATAIDSRNELPGDPHDRAGL